MTLGSALIWPRWPPKGVNVFFAGCLVLICGSHLVLVSTCTVFLRLRSGNVHHVLIHPRGTLTACADTFAVFRLADFLVPPGGPGAAVPKSDILQRVHHHRALSVRQPLHPRRRVEPAPADTCSLTSFRHMLAQADLGVTQGASSPPRSILQPPEVDLMPTTPSNIPETHIKWDIAAKARGIISHSRCQGWLQELRCS